MLHTEFQDIVLLLWNVYTGLFHLRLICLFSIVLSEAYFLDKLTTIGNGSFQCELLSFTRSFVHAANALVGMWVFLSRRNVPELYGGFLHPFYKLYTAAAIGSIPSVWTTEYHVDLTTGLGRCKPITLAGSFGVTLTYELARLIVFCFSVLGFMTYVLVKIRCKELLRKLYNKTIYKIIGKMYMEYILFIGLWLPLGLLLFCLNILDVQKTVSTTERGFYFGILTCTCFSYCLLYPAVYLRCIEKKSFVQIFCCDINTLNTDEQRDKRETEVLVLHKAPTGQNIANDKDEIEKDSAVSKGHKKVSWKPGTL